MSEKNNAYRARYSTSEFIIAFILVFLYPTLQKTSCSASIVPDPWEGLFPSIYLKWTDSKGFARLKYAHTDFHRLRRAYGGLWLKMYSNSLALSRQITCDSLVREAFSTDIHNHDDSTWIVPRYRLLEAARLLFEDPQPSENEYLFKPLDEKYGSTCAARYIDKGNVGGMHTKPIYIR